MARQLQDGELTLREYVEAAWPVLEPGQAFKPNWHIDAICEHLEAVTEGQIDRLIVNVPPRYSKSTLVTVNWPAWEWTLNPRGRWIFCSYSATLSTKHSTDRRTLIESPWYQARWGGLVTMALDQNEKTQFQNTRRGHMVATSIGGAIIGKGGNKIVIDDPQDPQRAESAADRERVNNVYDRSLVTRLDDKTAGAIVIVMQRLHEKDLAGHVAAKQPRRWT
ncbi:MAG: terminase, partial [Myxococcota bacterium]